MTSENDINDNLIESGRTPPDYTGNSTRNTPPSYGTLIQQLKDAQKKSSSKERLQNTCDILVNSIAFVIVLALLLTIPILMIVVGALNLHQCSRQPMIPVWMVVSGSILLFMLISSIASRINNLCCRCGLSPREQPGWNALERLYCTIISVLGCFSVAWFIAGSVWIYSIYPPNTNPNVGSLYCNSLTYYLGFSLLTMGHSTILFFCACSCCIAFTAGVGSA